jgi:hypothetical protein
MPAGISTAPQLLLFLSKNMLSHFLNSAFGRTEAKEAAYAVVGR